MNPFKQWIMDRRCARQAVAIKKRIEDGRDRELRRTKLKELCIRLRDELWHKKFNVIDWDSTNDNCTNATFYATTPNGRLLKVTVFHSGGIEMEDLNA